MLQKNFPQFSRILAKYSLTFLILFIFSPFAYAYISITQTDKRTDYPGKEIAQKIQKEWDSKYNGSIEIVEGNEWQAGNLSYHLKSRPKWAPKGIPLNMMGDSYDAEIFFNEYNIRVIGKK